MTCVTPASTSIGAETSPVKAPSFSKCMFWAATATGEPLAAATTAASAVNGGATSASPAAPATPFRISSTSATASATVLYIFQLPAISFLRMP